ncbi:MAG: 4Fe-4S cluster-binding domain-containing protein [Lachnospiraceae bacterium]|nr:4Fe-4S cluster-binding domain-containing protein [Lachnospiraceae bacterium]
MYINSLIIEVTRKCNAKCEHCLRGPAQNCDIDTKYIDKLLDDVTGIRSITFSGGEPSLNIKAIRHTYNEIVKRNIQVNDIFVVTNAKKYSLGLVRIMNDWFKYCFNNNNYSYSEIDSKDIEEMKKQKEYCGEFYNQNVEDYLSECSFGLSISIDDFHPEADNKALRIYKTLPYYSNAKDQSKNNSFKYNLINEGNAKKNGIGARNRHLSTSFYVEEYSDEEKSVDMVYLNAKGYILPECDYSYKSQRIQGKGRNIMESSLEDIILKEVKIEAKEIA